MATTNFTACPDVDYKYVDELGVTILRYGGQAKEQRIKNQDIQRRRYSWPMSKINTEREAIDEFFRLRNQTVEAFYIRDPKDNARTGVSLGTAVSGQTGFTLPTTGENSRDYAISGATFTVYLNGSPTGITVTIDTDDRTFTFASAAASGDVVTADYHYYRLVRLSEPFEWTALAPNYFFTEPDFIEVPE